MLKISAAQMSHMTRLSFFERLCQFIRSRCRNTKLIEWLATQRPSHPTWTRLWPAVEHLSEHDCAMVLVFFAVCAGEGIATGSVEQLIDQLPQREIGIKSFLEARNYFCFSDFEFEAPPVKASERIG